MVEQIRVQELTTQEQKQDCGCGCSGGLCGTAKNDCGCGCGGSQCGTTQQKLVLVNSAQVTEMRQRAVTSGCDGSCGCWSVSAEPLATKTKAQDTRGFLLVPYQSHARRI